MHHPSCEENSRHQHIASAQHRTSPQTCFHHLLQNDQQSWNVMNLNIWNESYVELWKRLFWRICSVDKQMVSFPFSFTRGSCGLLRYIGCLAFLIFSLSEIDLWLLAEGVSMFLSYFQKRLYNLMYLSGRMKDQKFSFSNWLLNSQLQGVDVGSSSALEGPRRCAFFLFCVAFCLWG